ncbi:hypothetical protein JDV02_003039 [Purpureocillium takamizusanense]|uniref:Major facilitator superfamily (MFS) profile domain-containing protein n=1 Tax=Purpureocillium takamizusanense TaxID=2060973 RepID=A0A9Q8QBM4_9HYPO|nr:uncharacterized protein JDV02_003039 [Purpureocillium takamizusanense]UNI16615.1 hypothetical protein JDV02_003039 [Purpureocillium takamizusanense]
MASCSATSTATIELQSVDDFPGHPAPAAKQLGDSNSETQRHVGRKQRAGGSDRGDFGSSSDGRGLLGELGGSEPSPSPPISVAETWNEPRRNSYRLGAAFWCFLVMGANDSAYGPLIPYLEKYYDLTYIVVSLVFLSPFIGYVASALLNNTLHHKFGQRGVALICASSHLAAYAVIAAHPPYIVLVFAFILAGFGNGVADAAWNAWVGNLANSSELLGFLHALYGVGGVVSPLVATTLITKANLPWYTFYYIMIGLAGIELAVLASAFWDSNGATYRSVYQESEADSNSKLIEALFQKPASRVCWVAAVFLLCYVGAEVALGGWIVTFMLRVRHGEDFASGMSAVGFWLGITLGRAVLGFVTPRIGVKVSTAVRAASIPKGSPKLAQDGELTYVHPVLHRGCHGSGAHLLARPAVLRLGRGRRLPRLLPGAHVPQRGPRRQQVAAAAPARCGDWLRGGVWRLRRGAAALPYRPARAVVGRPRAAAHHPGAAGDDAGRLATVSAHRQETGLRDSGIWPSCWVIGLMLRDSRHEPHGSSAAIK